MALPIPNISKTSVAADGSYSIVTDGTVYGAPNSDRNQVAVYFRATKVDENLVESALENVAFNPETATYFQYTNTIDGYYKIYFVIVPNYDNVPVYEKYNMVWDTGQNKFYQFINDTPAAGILVTDTLYWAVVPDPTVKIADIDTEQDPQNIAYQVLGDIADYITAKCYATAIVESFQESCGQEKGCGCGTKLGKAVSRLRTLLSVMRVCNVRGLFVEGERAARQAETYCDDCGCLNR